MKIPKSCMSVYPKRNHPSFIIISPTVVIETLMKRSSRVLQHENPKIRFSFQKRSKLIVDLCWSAEITLASSISVINWKVLTSTTAWEIGNPKNWFFLRTCLPYSVSVVMFCKHFFYLILCTLIGLLSHAFHKHSCRFQHISALINYMHIYISTSFHHWTLIL